MKNQDNLADLRAGNDAVLKFFVGQVIRGSRGQANPSLVNRILRTHLRVNHEKAVAEVYLKAQNATAQTRLRIEREGLPPEPDLILFDESGQELGLEVTSTYLNKSEAQFTWNEALQTYLATPIQKVWQSGVISEPDEEYRRRLYEAVRRKLDKKYSTKQTILVVEFNYWLGDKHDAEGIVDSVAEKLKGRPSPFTEVWVVWKATDGSETYQVFKLLG